MGLQFGWEFDDLGWAQLGSSAFFAGLACFWRRLVSDEMGELRKVALFLQFYGLT